MAPVLTFNMGAREAAQRLGRAQVSGSGYKASCPVSSHGKGRGDRTPSLTLNDGDDGRLLVHCKAGCAQDEVLEALIDKGVASREGDAVAPKPRRQQAPVRPDVDKPSDEWEAVPLNTPGAQECNIEDTLIRAGVLDRQKGDLFLVKRDIDRKVVERHPVDAINYLTICLRDGQPASHDVRISYGWQEDKGKPNKEHRPVSLWRHLSTGRFEWRARQWSKPVPVFGQENVKAGDIVIVHEGPTKAVHGENLLAKYAHVAWANGAGFAGHHDWSFLAGCVVIGMPDNDKPGMDGMSKVRDLALKAGAASFEMVQWPETMPDGGAIDDLAEVEAGSDDAEMLIVEALARSAENTAPKKAFTRDEADLSDLAGFELHEDGIAMAFADKYKDRLRYCHTRGSWYHWTGSHWQIEQTSLAFSWSRELCRQFYKSQNNVKVRNFIAKVATASAVERFARSDRAFAVTSDVWDKNLFLLGTPDGVVDLRTGKLRPANPGDNISKVTSVSPAAPGTPAPTWQKFLQDATRGDKELQRFLAQMVGYSLTGDVSEECLFFVHGPGGNGKGVFLRTIGAIMGDYATSASMDTFTASKGDKHPTDLAKLAGARMVTASETEEGKTWAEARIKELTGNERPISARFMRQDFFEYTPQFKLVIVGNHRPVLNNVDEAARRRFNIIPFTFKPTEKNPKLKDELEAEYPAILRWMIDGCLDWQKNGLVRPTSVIEATQEYFDSQDVFGQWVKECCDLYPGSKEQYERPADLYESWVRYCTGHGEEPGKERDLGTKLTKIDVVKATKRLGSTVFAARAGIRLKAAQASHDGPDGLEGGF